MKVLLVDDDADIRQIGTLSLSRIGGFQVVVADSGKAAIEVALQQLPAVILLDMMMPGMDGVATLRAMREQPALADTPVIFMTAKVQGGEVEHYLRAGARGVIQKPFDPLKLASEVRRILAAA